MEEKFVLGLDIGISSVGWAVVEENSAEIVEAGVRLFPSAEAKSNQDRRSYRNVRRNNRRKQNRLRTLKQFLEQNHIKETEKHYNNPVEMRHKGLREKLNTEELYTALYHLIKHRGVSYLEDIEEVKENDRVLGNIKNIGHEFPCEIQYARYKKYGFYRGVNKVEDEIFMNTFTISMYEKEARALLKEQSKYHKQIDTSFIETYIHILKTKRKYYIGPGNELSRTNYGVYKTNGETKDNLFDELRGKCSVYSGKYGMDSEFRASGASYTVQKYNLLNDLCNVRIAGEKLTKLQKLEVMEYMKNNKIAVSITLALKRLYKIEATTVTGYRLDKNGKEENHSFEVYRIMRKQFEANGMEIKNFSEQVLDTMADILTLNTETQGILDCLANKNRLEYEITKNLTSQEIEAFISIRRNRSGLFTKWSSFSYRLIKQVLPEMIRTGDEQHTCIKRLNLRSMNLNSENKIDYHEIISEIYNPVAARSVVQSVRIINELLKKYQFSSVVLEMPRDRDLEEEKVNIKKIQKSNEDTKKKALQYAGLSESEIDYRNDKKMLQKFKLYYKQKGKCLYSGRNIDINAIINGSLKYEIDHIIPISISFDDSQSNKVLVEADQNRKKSNMTPYKYLATATGVWTYKEYKEYVLKLRNQRLIVEKHKSNLLLEEDITKEEIKQSFIANNVNDSRYASKVILRELEYFFKQKETKVKILNGAMTSQLRRKTLEYDKDREHDFRAYAQGAMICCYTFLSLQHYNERESHLEKENISQEKDNDTIYLEYSGWDIRKKILSFHKNIKISHKIDSKVNRSISNQTIYGTRQYNGYEYVVKKIHDIYDKTEYEKFKKKIEKDPTSFLMYQHDPKTWNKLMEAIKQYQDTNLSPLAKYQEENGPFRKYSKKGNGPIIKELKYLDHKANSTINISHKYPESKNKVVLEGLKALRADVYYHKEDNRYEMVPLRNPDLEFKNGKYCVSIQRYEELLSLQGILKVSQHIQDIKEGGYEFMFTLYKNSIIQLDYQEESLKVRFLAKNHAGKNRFEVKEIDKVCTTRCYKAFNRKLKSCTKYHVDVLGNEYQCKKEKLKLEYSLDNSMIS